MEFFNNFWPFKKSRVEENPSPRKPSIEDFIDSFTKGLLDDTDKQLVQKRREFELVRNNTSDDEIYRHEFAILSLQRRNDQLLFEIAKRHESELDAAIIDAIKMRLADIDKRIDSLNAANLKSADNLMRRDFEVGDTVCLKSGGPVMSVSSVKFSPGLMGSFPHFIIVCQWHDKDMKLCEKEIGRAHV